MSARSTLLCSRCRWWRRCRCRWCWCRWWRFYLDISLHRFLFPPLKIIICISMPFLFLSLTPPLIPGYHASQGGIPFHLILLMSVQIIWIWGRNTSCFFIAAVVVDVVQVHVVAVVSGDPDCSVAKVDVVDVNKIASIGFILTSKQMAIQIVCCC